MKLYRSKKWLAKKYQLERLSEQQIADLCGVTKMTINGYLRKYNLKREK